jgi:hypothetical protein
MLVFDCDDETEFAELETTVAEDGLLELNLLQSFAPDTLAEAKNRGFRPRSMGESATLEEDVAQ